MNESIYNLNDYDQTLLDRYCEINDIGEIFADADCTRLVKDWRDIALEIIQEFEAKHK